MSFVAAIFVRYWRQLTVVGIALALLFGAYAKGRRDCAARAERVIVREIQRRYKNVEDEQRHIRKVDENFQKAKRERPSERDKINSCILSNDPYTARCL